ncbi:MAG: flagellar brake protein [Thermodesulfobacteriota bacterium]
MAGTGKSANRVSEISGEVMPAVLGMRMLVEAQGLEPGFRTTLSGLERGRFLLLHLPRTGGITEQLYPERKVKVRYIHEGNLYGFLSQVVACQVTPFRLLYLAYPKAFERLNLRRDQRVDCFIPAGLEMPGSVGPAYRAMVMNISTSGCRAALDAAGQRLPGFEVGNAVRLGFRLAGSELDITLECLVKSLDADGSRVFLGLIFAGLDEDGRDAIAGYVASVSCFLDV